MAKKWKQPSAHDLIQTGMVSVLLGALQNVPPETAAKAIHCYNLAIGAKLEQAKNGGK